MQKNLIIVVFLALGLVLGLGELAAQSGKIVVHIEQVKDAKGQIGVLLFNKAQGFPGDDKASLRQELRPARKGKMSVTFDNVPYGTYAITVMHDENGNLKVDTNMLGIPKEGYGFSNNARNLFRAPRFAEAAFELKTASVSLDIELLY